MQGTRAHRKVDGLEVSTKIIWKGNKFRCHHSHGKFYGLFMKTMVYSFSSTRCCILVIAQNELIALKNKSFCSVSPSVSKLLTRSNLRGLEWISNLTALGDSVQHSQRRPGAGSRGDGLYFFNNKEALKWTGDKITGSFPAIHLL